jgi:aryl-alcohol dehydrogenase-like predicted oxidoreductase
MTGFSTATFSRNEFLKLLGAAGVAGATLGVPAFAAQPIATRKIPKSGEAMPVIGIGTSRVFDISAKDDTDMAIREKVLRILFEGGGKMVDTAPSYGMAEDALGALFERMKARNKAFLATKVRTTGKQEGIAEMEESFKYLKTKMIDLMYVHNLRDTKTQIATIRDWKSQGRIRYTGVSHFKVKALENLEAVIAQEPLDFIQMKYSLKNPDAAERLFPLCQEKGVAVVINRAFERGKLFRAVKGKPVPEWAQKELGCQSWAQFFLKFALGHPAVTCVIPGTDKPKYMIDNLGAGRGPLPDAKQSKKMLNYWRSL